MNTISKRLILFCAAALVSVQSCAVGPDYKRPEISVPKGWSEGSPGVVTTQNELADWWNGFRDPVLDDLIGRALNSNLDLQIAYQRIIQAREQVAQMDGRLWPALDAGASLSTSNASQNGGTTNLMLGESGISLGIPLASGSGNATVFKAGFDASWELDFAGKNRRLREASEANLRASVEQGRDALVTLTGDVADYYVQLLATRRRLALARSTVESRSRTAELIVGQYQGGMKSYLDMARAKASAASSASAIPSLESAERIALHRLAALTGQTPDSLQIPDKGKNEFSFLLRPIPIGLPSQLLARRPDIRQAEQKLAMACANIGAAKADLYPRVTLTGDIGVQGTSTSQLNHYWSYGPSLSIPIFHRGQKRSIVREKESTYEEALLSYRKTIQNAFEEVENALARHRNEQVNHQKIEEEVRLYREVVQVAQNSYAQGFTSLLETLDAERSMYDAEDRLIQSEAALMRNAISLYKITGGGWKEKIGQR